VDPVDLDEYAAHDLVGSAPSLRSSVVPRAVHDDGLDVFEPGDADRLAVPAVFLCAPRGMVDDPHPMQPLPLVQAWAAAEPTRRRALPVPDVNHFTVVLGRFGAAQVADAIAGMVSGNAAPAAAPARPNR
jgi:hypothetical protein